MSFRNPTCPKCEGTLDGARIEVRFKQFITGRYAHGGTVCRVIYMLPKDAKKQKRRDAAKLGWRRRRLLSSG